MSQESIHTEADESPMGFGPTLDPNGSVLGRYPLGSDIEVVAALRHFLACSGCRPEDLDARAGLQPGTVAKFTAGRAVRPSPELRQICGVLGIPFWTLLLQGAVIVGAEAGFQELQEILERQRRLREEGNPEQITRTDLAVEAVEILLGLGEDLRGSPDSPSGSRRALAEGVRRLARRAERRGEHGSACFLDSVAAIVHRGVEALSDTELEPVVDVLDLARSLENGPGLNCDEGEVPR